jgi:hypothetical protein
MDEADEPSEVHWVYYVEMSFASLSITGCVFIILIFIIYKRLRSFPFELIVYLVFATMMNTLSYIMNYIPQYSIIMNMHLCRSQAFIMIWFEISQFIWSVLIGFYVYRNVVHINGEENTSMGERICYLLIGFGFPLIFSFIGLFSNLLGPAGKWCWIVSQEDLLWPKIFGAGVYVLIWILIILNLFFTLASAKFLRKIASNERERALVSYHVWKLMKYPIIQFFCLIPATINRLIFYITNKYIFVFQTISLISLSLQGLIYAVSYGLNPQVKRAILDSLAKRCPCCKILQPRQSYSSSFTSSEPNERYIHDGSFIM